MDVWGYLKDINRLNGCWTLTNIYEIAAPSSCSMSVQDLMGNSRKLSTSACKKLQENFDKIIQIT